MRAEVFEDWGQSASHFNRVTKQERKLATLTAELRTARAKGEDTTEVQRLLDRTFKKLWCLRMKS